MRTPGQNSSSRRTGKSRGGFTLLEAFLGLIVLGAGALLLFSVLNRIWHRAQREQWAEEWKGFAVPFAEHRERLGRWPDIPADLGTALPGGWQKPSPFGGQFEWRPPETSREAGMIRLTAFHPHSPLTCTREDLLAVDRIIDDGDLATGRFRTGFNGWPVYRIEPKP